MSLFWIFIIMSIAVTNATETPKLILYEHPGTADGKTATLTEAILNFDDKKLAVGNNEVSSVQAVSGRWILYQYPNYNALNPEGKQMVVEQPRGRHDVIDHDQYSSARPSYSEIRLREKKSHEEGGDVLSLYGATPDFKLVKNWLTGSGWLNDEVSSVQAPKGNWELYEDKNYEGKKMIVEEGSQFSNALKNDKYSSARPICNTYQNDPATAEIKVFEGRSQQPPSNNFFTDNPRLDSWDDLISSIRVKAGIWEFYEDEDYEGKRLVVKPEDTKDIKKKYYSSLRPVCETYSPTPEQCEVTSMTIINDGIVAKKDDSGTQIVGIIADSSCEGGATGHLHMDRTDSVEESVGIETGEDKETNWAVSMGVSTTISAAPFGPEFEVSMEASTGGSTTKSFSKSKETTTGYSQSVGYELEYATPAVAVLFGSVDKYTIDTSNVPSILHMNCPEGPRNKTSTVTLKSTTYQAADYWYLIKDLDQAVCDAHYKEIYTCMQKFKDTYSKRFEAREKIKDAFEECFNF